MTNNKPTPTHSTSKHVFDSASGVPLQRTTQQSTTSQKSGSDSSASKGDGGKK